MFTLSDTRPRHPDVAAWLGSREGFVGAIACDLFARIRAIAPSAREAMHDHQATACLGDAAFAYVAAFETHANLGFFHGADLPDPAGLLQGGGKAMRHVKFRPGNLPDTAAVEALIAAAWADIQTRAAG